MPAGGPPNRCCCYRSGTKGRFTPRCDDMDASLAMTTTTAEQLLAGESFDDETFVGLDLAQANLGDKLFAGCTFRNVKLAESRWRRARLEDCVLEGCRSDQAGGGGAGVARRTLQPVQDDGHRLDRGRRISRPGLCRLQPRLLLLHLASPAQDAVRPLHAGRGELRRRGSDGGAIRRLPVHRGPVRTVRSPARPGSASPKICCSIRRPTRSGALRSRRRLPSSWPPRSASKSRPDQVSIA